MGKFTRRVDALTALICDVTGDARMRGSSDPERQAWERMWLTLIAVYREVLLESISESVLLLIACVVKLCIEVLWPINLFTRGWYRDRRKLAHFLQHC